MQILTAAKYGRNLNMFSSLLSLGDPTPCHTYIKMSKSLSWMVSTLRNLRGHPKKLMGSDVSGNSYYERLTRSMIFIDILQHIKVYIGGPTALYGMHWGV